LEGDLVLTVSRIFIVGNVMEGLEAGSKRVRGHDFWKRENVCGREELTLRERSPTRNHWVQGEFGALKNFQHGGIARDCREEKNRKAQVGRHVGRKDVLKIKVSGAGSSAPKENPLRKGKGKVEEGEVGRKKGSRCGNYEEKTAEKVRPHKDQNEKRFERGRGRKT